VRLTGAMRGSAWIDVRDEDTQLVIAVARQLRLDHTTDSFLDASPRQHQLTKTLDANFH